MEISFDPEKRKRALAERGLDFAGARELFAGRHLTVADIRTDYGEPRYLSFGTLKGRMVVVVWTPRDGGRRIISMRFANERERKRVGGLLD